MAGEKSGKRTQESKPVLKLAIEGAGLTPADIPLRQLIELLEATVGTIDAVAEEASLEPPIMRLVAVRSGSAAYDLFSQSPTAEEVVERLYDAAKSRGASSTTPVRKCLTRLHAATSKLGALRLSPTAVGTKRAPKPILLAAPVSEEPLVWEEEDEIHGRIVGLSLGAEGVIKVRLRLDESRGGLELSASEETGKAAARRFGQWIRGAVTHEVAGDKRSSTLESFEQWDPEDLLSVLRSVRDELAAGGVVVDAEQWLAELS